MAQKEEILGRHYEDETRGATQPMEPQSSMQETTGGLSSLLACCGILKAPALAEKENKSFDSILQQKYEQAAFQLLRTKSIIPSNFTRILHIRQAETWDCGIACIEMVLQFLRQKDDDYDNTFSAESAPPSPLQQMERSMLLSKVGTQSIWTVDLVMLLEQLLQENANTQEPNHENTTYLFSSEVFGVNAQHSTTGYYEKAFTADSARVDKLCQDMSRLNLPVLCPFHMEFHQMIDLVSNAHCIAILLVDNQILMKSPELDEDTLNDSHAYMGHYVVVCGISRDPDHLLDAYTREEIEMEAPNNPYCVAVANPGSINPVMFVKPSKLERAWRADGTDCDVIFVAKHRRGGDV